MQPRPKSQLLTVLAFMLLSVGMLAGWRVSVDESGASGLIPSLTGGSPSPSPSPLPPQVTAPGVLTTGPSGAVLAPAPGQPGGGRLRAGVVLPVEAVESGWALVLTPCENRGWIQVDDEVVHEKVSVLLDPGHGGNEVGAVGPAGLAEKEVNLDIAKRAATALSKEGIPTLLTRYDDYRATLVFRTALGSAARADALVSIHHNAVPDGPFTKPGTEIFYQHASPQSKRLAGLLYEETVQALSKFPAQWVGNIDAGAKWRLNLSGSDFYGILRHSAAAGKTATLAELAFISNPTEEALLARRDVRSAEAGAVTRGVYRYLKTDDPGSGFSVPRLVGGKAGPGGGRSGCVDPS